MGFCGLANEALRCPSNLAVSFPALASSKVSSQHWISLPRPIPRFHLSLPVQGRALSQQRCMIVMIFRLLLWSPRASAVTCEPSE